MFRFVKFSNIKDLFESWVLSSAHREPSIGKSLSEQMTTLVRENEIPKFPADCEQPLQQGNVLQRGSKRSCRLDSRINIIIQRQIGQSNGPAVLLIEAGLRNEDWWFKVDQSLIRIKKLGKAISEPLLLAVFTVSNHGKPRQFKACLGVFLVTPKKSDFRVSLLWRGQFLNLKDLATGFERVMRGMVFLTKWNEELPAPKAPWLQNRRKGKFWLARCAQLE
jgi:hypothetical protein